ncbi:hypothetical protein Tco_0296693 [Tanacetum coccineum]
MSSVGKFVHDSNKAPDSPPHAYTFSSNQHHCFHCKDVLGDGEFCQQCTCMRCGSGLSKGLCLICASRHGNNPNPNSLNDSPNISENVSQSPHLIDHHCCYGCGDSLDVPIIPNPEACNNQTVDELPQTLPSFDPTCYSRDGSSFTYDSTPNFVDDSPNIFNPPSQPPTYSCEFCGNDAHYGYDCPPQVPFIYNPEPCYNQDFNFPCFHYKLNPSHSVLDLQKSQLIATDSNIPFRSDQKYARFFLDLSGKVCHVRLYNSFERGIESDCDSEDMEEEVEYMTDDEVVMSEQEERVKNTEDALINIIKSIKKEMKDDIMKKQIEASTPSIGNETSSIASNEVDIDDDKQRMLCLLPKGTGQDKDELMNIESDLFTYNTNTCESCLILAVDTDLFTYERKAIGVYYDDNDDFYDPDQCEESRNNEIRERIIHNLHEEWFKGTFDDEDDIEGIIDYLEPTSYDGIQKPRGNFRDQLDSYSFGNFAEIAAVRA